ncbi:hypothetical protein FPV67DRAFT_1776490 [Lyophyllum atratum]|nr:hypothetical protein FPV67DRAFT_1776490 [Lyophyllum atratum]
MSNSWMPPKGRRSVVAGSSFTRALNARKVKGPPPASKSLYLRDFYSFRYNFRPPSVDPGERGKIVVKKGKDSTSVTVERPSTQPSEAHQWLGTEIPAKEWECVLIYDEVSDTYTLEKLDSHMVLTHQHKPIHLEPAVPTPPAESPAKRKSAYEEQLERDLAFATDEDADGEADDDFEEILPKATAPREEEEEEEVEEVIPTPPPPPAPVPVAKSKPRPARTTKPKAAAPAPAPPAAPVVAAKARPAAMPAARPKAAPASRARKHKREPEPVPTHHLSDADEEDLEFGKPAKRARPSPPSQGLALPSASSSIYTPPPPIPVIQRSPSPHAIETGSDSEEDWDEVAAVGKAMDTEDEFDIFGDAVGGADDGEDIDVNALEAEINLQMDEASDDDFLAAAVEAPPSHGAPMSLQELAGATAYASEDEYSSSEETDED